MTGKVILSPTVPEDLPHVIGEPLPFRIKAMTARVGDTVLGVGGFGFHPDGAVIAFMQLAPGAHRYPVAMTKAAKRMMEVAKRDGYARLIASTDLSFEPARRFLERLGFKMTEYEVGGHAIFTWSPE